MSAMPSPCRPTVLQATLAQTYHSRVRAARSRCSSLLATHCHGPTVHPASSPIAHSTTLAPSPPGPPSPRGFHTTKRTRPHLPSPPRSTSAPPCPPAGPSAAPPPRPPAPAAQQRTPRPAAAHRGTPRRRQAIAAGPAAQPWGGGGGAGRQRRVVEIRARCIAAHCWRGIADVGGLLRSGPAARAGCA